MIYRKRGSVVRWENGTLVRVEERGMAIEDGQLFECRPEAHGAVPAIESDQVLEVVAAVVAVTRRAGVSIERLMVIDGIADHEHGDEQWSERTQRLHLSMTHGSVRVLLDLGPFTRASTTHEIEGIAERLARCQRSPREVPGPLRLAPGVAAAMIPELVGIAPPNVRLLQTAGGVDGRGQPIVEASGEGPGGWPNWFRPSYRVRPVRMPLHLRLECDVQAVDPELPVAVALLGPVSRVSGSLTLHVLVDDSRSVFPSMVRVSRIDAVAIERIWYPYGGGSFGAEMML